MLRPSNDSYCVYRVIVSSENLAMGGTGMRVELTESIR